MIAIDQPAHQGLPRPIGIWFSYRVSDKDGAIYGRFAAIDGLVSSHVSYNFKLCTGMPVNIAEANCKRLDMALIKTGHGA